MKNQRNLAIIYLRSCGVTKVMNISFFCFVPSSKSDKKIQFIANILSVIKHIPYISIMEKLDINFFTASNN